MTKPIPHGQVPEALIDLIDAYAETRHRCGGIYNARTEAARNAVIEALSGVQALSAAPEIHEPKCPALDGAGCTCAKPDPTIDRAWAQFCGGIGDGLDAPYPGMISAFERYYSQSFADKAWRNEASVWAAAWKSALLAASPTPPAEQQVIIDFAQVGTAGPFHVTHGRVKLPDATMQDLVRMLRPTYDAEQAAPKAAPGDVLDESLRERDDAEDFIDALLDEVLGHERPEWSSSYGRADALNDVQERMTALHKPAVDKAWGRFQSAMAAPQQEAREAAPGESLDECFPGESRVAVPQGLISAACFAIRNKRDGGKVLEQLRRYSVGDLSQPLAPTSPAEQQAPSAAAADTVALQAALRAIHQAIDLIGEPDTERLRTVRRVLRGAVIVAEDAGEAATAPQPAPAPLSDDVVRDAARWRMVALIGNEVMLHPEKRTQAAAVKAYMDATHSGSDLTGAVDAALAAQRGNK